MVLADGGEPASRPVAGRGEWAAAGEPPFPLVYWAGQYEGLVTLHDGRVLAAGGAGPDLRSVSTAALYDPAHNSWTTTGELRQDRRLHTLTVLADGRVLAAGGTPGPQAYPQPALDSTELYDPESGTWEPGRPMAAARTGHSATLLPDGRVLVAGGLRPRDTRTVLTLAAAELFDPDTGTWTPARDMLDPRWHHAAALLPDGRVLAVGGLTATERPVLTPLGWCETYDPLGDRWTATGALHSARSDHQAVPLPDGSVLVLGGGRTPTGDARHDPYGPTGVERYDPATGTWQQEAPLPWGRCAARALALPSGEVLVCGGADPAVLDCGYPSALRYDPAAHRWYPAGPLRTGRWIFGATSLADGRVLVAGGVTRTGVAAPALGADVPATQAEVFTP
ncbi:kelch repeat-containing protein [Streptomyces sp. NPDC050803]|uniref:Kelch repeat-containing protein n=1 Tax=unclassified Streptomyces TaxID=2593676 RepID=UPI0034190146